MVGGVLTRWLGGRIDRGLAWAVAGFVLYAAGPYVALLPMSALQAALSLFGLAPEVGTSGWGVMLGLHAIAWGGIVLVASGWLGLRIVPGLQPSRRGALVAAVVGLGLAALTEVCLHQFVVARFGEYMVRAAGLAFFAGPAMVATAASAWAALAAPRALRRPEVVAVTLSGICFVAAALPGLPGIWDGISPSGAPIAVALGLDALFVLAVLVALLRDRREE